MGFNSTAARGVAAVACALAFAGCAHHGGDQLQIALQWRSSDDPHDLKAEALSAFANQTAQVVLAGDARHTPPNAVGQNNEESQPRPVTTGDDVGAFVVGNVINLLQASGVAVVPQGGSRVLQLRVASFFVNEDNTYNADVTLDVTLTDGGGKVLWQGPAVGASKRWGRSFNEENYQEALSNALSDAVKNLLGTPGFAQAAATGTVSIPGAPPQAGAGAPPPPGAYAPAPPPPQGPGLTIPLQWRSTDDPHAMKAAALGALANHTVHVSLTADARQTPRNIVGQNNQAPLPRPVATVDDVSAFVVGNVSNILLANGVSVVPQGATRELQLKLNSFFVTEDNTYNADVTFAVTLTDAQGKVLWRGAAVGTSHRWGRSFLPENYQEALSNALSDAVKNLLGTPGFAQAASGA